MPGQKYPYAQYVPWRDQYATVYSSGAPQTFSYDKPLGIPLTDTKYGFTREEYTQNPEHYHQMGVQRPVAQSFSVAQPSRQQEIAALAQSLPDLPKKSGAARGIKKAVYRAPPQISPAQINELSEQKQALEALAAPPVSAPVNETPVSARPRTLEGIFRGLKKKSAQVAAVPQISPAQRVELQAQALQAPPPFQMSAPQRYQPEGQAEQAPAPQQYAQEIFPEDILQEREPNEPEVKHRAEQARQSFVHVPKDPALKEFPRIGPLSLLGTRSPNNYYKILEKTPYYSDPQRSRAPGYYTNKKTNQKRLRNYSEKNKKKTL